MVRNKRAIQGTVRDNFGQHEPRRVLRTELVLARYDICSGNTEYDLKHHILTCPIGNIDIVALFVPALSIDRDHRYFQVSAAGSIRSGVLGRDLTAHPSVEILRSNIAARQQEQYDGH